MLRAGITLLGLSAILLGMVQPARGDWPLPVPALWPQIHEIDGRPVVVFANELLIEEPGGLTPCVAWAGKARPARAADWRVQSVAPGFSLDDGTDGLRMGLYSAAVQDRLCLACYGQGEQAWGVYFAEQKPPRSRGQIEALVLEEALPEWDPLLDAFGLAAHSAGVTAFSRHAVEIYDPPQVPPGDNLLSWGRDGGTATFAAPRLESSPLPGTLLSCVSLDGQLWMLSLDERELWLSTRIDSSAAGEWRSFEIVPHISFEMAGMGTVEHLQLAAGDGRIFIVDTSVLRIAMCELGPDGAPRGWLNWRGIAYETSQILGSAVQGGALYLLAEDGDYTGRGTLTLHRLEPESPADPSQWRAVELWKDGLIDAGIGTVGGRLAVAIVTGEVDPAHAHAINRKYTRQQLIYGAALKDAPLTPSDWRFTVVIGQGRDWRTAGPASERRSRWFLLGGAIAGLVGGVLFTRYRRRTRAVTDAAPS